MTGTPYIPDRITVHLGYPDDSSAPNVTLDFPEYIANVASGELYPTWPENALRANIYAIVSFALNRIYTEWYRSRGYDFDITSTTQYDQTFDPNRTIFQNIRELTDELFNDYVVRQGEINPYFTAYCDGIQTTCDGLYQWGTVDLANRGYTPYEILQYYYGPDINIVKNAPIERNIPSFVPPAITFGEQSDRVRLMQTMLNRISGNYPAIPKINPVTGNFLEQTEAAAKKFQSIFGLDQTGIIDKATWYKISYIYTSVKRLAELDSEGIKLGEATQNISRALQRGDSGRNITYLQYFLAVIGAYYAAVEPVEITGEFDEQTEDSVKSFQRTYGLEPTGIVDAQTWSDLYRAYAGIVENAPVSIGEALPLYPGSPLSVGMTNDYVRVIQQYLTFIHDSYPDIPAVPDTGYFGTVTEDAVKKFQQTFGLTPTGRVDAVTWNKLSSVFSDLKYGYVKQPGQYPGYIIT